MTAVLTQAWPVPRLVLRVLPVPDSDPSARRLDADGPDRAIRFAPFGAERRSVPLPGFAEVIEDGDDDLDRCRPPRPTTSSELPDPAAWTARVVQAVVEVLAGVRPPAQLTRWASDEVLASLVRRATIGRHRSRTAGQLGARGEGQRPPVVRRVRICPVRDGVVEASAVVVSAGRARAVAVRLEGLDGRWQLTALELG